MSKSKEGISGTLEDEFNVSKYPVKLPFDSICGFIALVEFLKDFFSPTDKEFVKLFFEDKIIDLLNLIKGSTSNVLLKKSINGLLELGKSTAASSEVGGVPKKR